MDSAGYVVTHSGIAFAYSYRCGDSMKSLLFFVALLMALLVTDRTVNQEFRVAENLRQQQVLQPSSAPDPLLMILTNSVVLLEEGNGAAVLFKFFADSTGRG